MRTWLDASSSSMLATPPARPDMRMRSAEERSATADGRLPSSAAMDAAVLRHSMEPESSLQHVPWPLLCEMAVIVWDDR